MTYAHRPWLLSHGLPRVDMEESFRELCYMSYSQNFGYTQCKLKWKRTWKMTWNLGFEREGILFPIYLMDMGTYQGTCKGLYYTTEWISMPILTGPLVSLTLTVVMW